MYKKTLIRQTLVQYLKDNVTSVADRIFGGRINPKIDKDYPYITVSSKSEEIPPDQNWTGKTTRSMDLIISGVVTLNGTTNFDFDEIVENLMFEIETAMSKIVTSTPIGNDPYRLFNEVVLDQTTIDTDNSSGKDIGMAHMLYKIEYDYENPIVPLILEDFDLAGSIDNLIITNPGVPQ